jgi:hypothetical protein
MFGSSKPVVLDRYGHRRSRLRVPRWLVLLLLGITAGAGGLLYLQENHLPKRLSAQASTELRDAFEQADAERTKLKADLADVTKRLDVALTEAKTATTELAASRQTVERLRAGLDFVAAALPPDPRGGSVEVRAARFDAPRRSAARSRCPTASAPSRPPSTCSTAPRATCSAGASCS